MTDESHYVGETHHGGDVYVEVWCPDRDETKHILGLRYVRHCPMCGAEVDIDD